MEFSEIEFLAEKSLVYIIPTNTIGKVHLVSGDIGPLYKGNVAQVPLWFAINLKQQAQCSIIPPSWMTVTALEETLQAEKQSKNFLKMPAEYMVVSKILLNSAPEDMVDSIQIKTLIRDIWDVRMSKLRTSVDALIRGGSLVAAMDNLTLMEIHTIRPLLPSSMDQIYRFRHPRKSGTQTQNTASLSLNTSRF